MDRMSAADYRRLMGLEPAAPAPLPPVAQAAAAARPDLDLGRRAHGGFKGLRLRDLPGPPSLAALTEHDLQVQVVRHFRAALLAPCSVIAVANQRTLGHLPDAVARKILRALVAEGMVIGALDTLFEWDPRLGVPGNYGACWVEMKRPVKPKPVSEEQLAFIARQRSMGRVAGWAQSLEQVEDLLVEAGAPLRMRLPRQAAQKDGAPTSVVADAPEQQPCER